MNKRFDSWEDLIQAKTEKRGDCLIWQAGTHSQGYPMVRWENRMQQVVRVQMELKTGQKLDGRNQRVKNRVCDDVLCVNPDHYIVADHGTEDWKCINFVYPLEDELKLVEIYDNYAHPKTGSKYGVWQEVKKAYPNMMKATMLKLVKKHRNIKKTID